MMNCGVLRLGLILAGLFVTSSSSLMTAPSAHVTDVQSIPTYQRGPIPNWLTPLRARRNGIAYLGSHERLRIAINKLIEGKKLLLTTIGGSVTVGNGCTGGLPWTVYLHNWLEDAFPNQVTLHNGAMPATMSNYMAACTSSHVPANSDIVIVEFAQNDMADAFPPMNNPARRAYERLLRKLLALPNHPAVLLVHAYGYRLVNGEYWGNAERDFHEFSTFYGLPSVSVKACCYQLMRQNLVGFRVDAIGVNASDPDPQILFKAFYGDGMHPGGPTGYRVVSELLIHLFMLVTKGVKKHKLQAADLEEASRPLPAPMIPGNYPGTAERCFVGEQLSSVVASHEGWTWLDESPTGDKRRKWGFVSTTVGAEMRLKLDTSTSVPGVTKVVGQLAYLTSYEHMGKAALSCEGGCKCDRHVVDGHLKDRKVSLMDLFLFLVSPSNECTVSITVLNETNSGEHKFKVQGIFINEEADNIFTSRGIMDTIQNMEFKLDGRNKTGS